MSLTKDNIPASAEVYNDDATNPDHPWYAETIQRLKADNKELVHHASMMEEALQFVVSKMNHIRTEFMAKSAKGDEQALWLQAHIKATANQYNRFIEESYTRLKEGRLTYASNPSNE